MQMQVNLLQLSATGSRHVNISLSRIEHSMNMGLNLQQVPLQPDKKGPTSTNGNGQMIGNLLLNVHLQFLLPFLGEQTMAVLETQAWPSKLESKPALKTMPCLDIIWAVRICLPSVMKFYMGTLPLVWKVTYDKALPHFVGQAENGMKK